MRTIIPYRVDATSANGSHDLSLLLLLLLFIIIIIIIDGEP
jgi:hypothetical protein